MTTVRETLNVLHALGGAVALFSMWIPIFSRKGGSAHRKAGRVFAACMAWVSISAVAASALRLAAEPDKPQGPLFLSLVAIQSAAATWWGVSVLGQKQRTDRSRSVADWISALALLFSGLLALAYWLQGAAVLFTIFGALNVVFGLRFVRVLARAPQSRFWWWYEHLFGMIVACIAALTAFFVVNYDNTPASFQSVIPPLVVWVAPGFIGGLGITLAMRHYRARLEGTSS
ncbi:MAG: hypothetical protein NTV21_05020 [Planctomycetota bacterium]|nr:hypothetical protein [Planctomycetota bacterium]